MKVFGVTGHVLAGQFIALPRVELRAFSVKDATAVAVDAPIFDLYGVEDELNRALERKVDLKSGGHLVIDQTEAMTTIDVNTGAFTGHRNLEETILKTNLEAAGTIARQLRLRNLGGIIIMSQRRGPREHIYLVLIIIVALAFLTDKIWATLGRYLFPYRQEGRR